MLSRNTRKYFIFPYQDSWPPADVVTRRMRQTEASRPFPRFPAFSEPKTIQALLNTGTGGVSECQLKNPLWLLTGNLEEILKLRPRSRS
jgi:hypothetical protein